MSIAEDEARAYWRAARHFRLTLRRGGDLTDPIDELDVIGMHSDSPRIRARAQALAGFGAKYRAFR